jgi:hypothetical protein
MRNTNNLYILKTFTWSSEQEARRNLQVFRETSPLDCVSLIWLLRSFQNEYNLSGNFQWSNRFIILVCCTQLSLKLIIAPALEKAFRSPWIIARTFIITELNGICVSVQYLFFFPLLSWCDQYGYVRRK